MQNCKLQFHVSWLHSYFRKNPDAVYTGADPGFLEESGSTRPRVKSARVSSAGSTRPYILVYNSYG